jgi:Pyridoxamine 5'-phosphate oxidase
MMASWAEFASADPALASRVEQRFAIRKHKTLATLRKDGSPRISGIEVEFADGELFLGMMPGSFKLRDLERDPRLALHSPTDDPPPDNARGWPGEAKLAGYAREVDVTDSRVAGGRRFRVDITEAVLTRLNDAGDRLVVESWHPGKGTQRLERT